jgi:multicomponent Na+:H+ antiporter subunit G
MRDAAIWILLATGVVIELLSCVGLFVVEDAFDRLHYLAPACTLGPVFIGAAVVVANGISLPGNKAMLVALLIIATSPALTHATARAARVRGAGHLTAFPAERVRAE